MRNFPKPTDSIGGIQKYWFVPVNDVAALGDIILNELQSITFETDKDWITGYAVYDSKQFSEDKKENKTGIRFLRSLKMFYPGFDLAAVNQMAEMHTTQFLVAYKDFNGLYKVAGTLENPLNFKYKLATGKDGSNAQGYDIEFFADSRIRISEIAEDQILPQTFDDWFLPSLFELDEMYDELKVFGVGDFALISYWSSTEWGTSPDSNAYKVRFTDGNSNAVAKSQTHGVRACRQFTAESGLYSLRDIGPASGLIFYISGTIYMEAAPSDQSTSKTWSNITDTSVGSTSPDIGTGQANTTTIINQAGHTDSAAKLCDDLSITN